MTGLKRPEFKREYVPREQSATMIYRTLTGMGFDKIGTYNYRDKDENRVFCCEMDKSHNTLIIQYEGREGVFSELTKKLPPQ